MTRSRLLAGGAVAAVLVAAGAWAWAGRDGRPVRTLEAGRHGPLVVSEPMVVRGAPGAVVDGGIVVEADDVRIEDVVVEGGESGISVRGAEGVVLHDVVVRGAALHGIEVVDASARVEGCRVSGLTHDYAQGIEVRNANGRPRTHVEGCRVDGGREGIVTHVSRVELSGNVVTATTNRGIAVTEMSEGRVTGNEVRGVTGVALFCGDMSRCDVRANRVRDVAPDPGGARSRRGQAFVAWYYSHARVAGNDFDVTASPAVDVHYASTRVEGDPLSRWPPGWPGAVPGLVVMAIALGALGVARVGVAPAARWMHRRWAPAGRGATSAGGISRAGISRAGISRAGSIGRDLLITVGAVQLFHVVEHLVQVHQVHVAWTESRQGLVGQRFDVEWLHLGFNGVVLAGVVAGMVLARRELFGRFPRGASWLLAGALVQVWHVVEHVVRVLQYLETGQKPAPGVFGDDLGLVWFHFGINVPIMAGLLVIGWAAAAPHVARWARRAPRSAPTPAPA